jgi:hypothetical protein
MTKWKLNDIAFQRLAVPRSSGRDNLASLSPVKKKTETWAFKTVVLVEFGADEKYRCDSIGLQCSRVSTANKDKLCFLKMRRASLQKFSYARNLNSYFSRSIKI